MTETVLPSKLSKQLDELDTLLRAFAQELANYSHEELNKSAKDGGWSAMQCVEHLKLSERGTLAYLQKKLSFSPDLPNKGFSDTWQRIVLTTYLRLPIKFNAPKGIGTAFLPESSEYDSSLEDWFQFRKHFRQAIGEIDPKYHNKLIFKHPLAGRLSLGTTLSFLIGHLQRHRRQALRVLNQA